MSKLLFVGFELKMNSYWYYPMLPQHFGFYRIVGLLKSYLHDRNHNHTLVKWFLYIEMAPWYLRHGQVVILNDINSSPNGQNGRGFPDDILRCKFLNEKFCILIKISLKCEHIKIMNISATSEWVQLLVRRRQCFENISHQSTSTEWPSV